jgi:hypothetical protein
MRLLLLGTCLALASCQPAPEPGDSQLPQDTQLSDTGPTVNGRLETVDGRDILHLWGTRYEMGYAEGALMCGRLTQVFEDYILNYLVAQVGYDWDTISALALGFIDIPQEYQEELEGIAAGMRENCPEEDLIVTSDHLGLGEGGSRPVELDDLLVANAVGDWACSSFTAWGEATATGAMIHARNFDYSIDPEGTFLDQHIVKVYTSSDEGDARFVSISTPGLVGCISCFTQEGTAFTMHNIVGLESSSGYSFTPRMLAMRQAIVASVGADDPAATVEQVLEDAPQYRGNGLHLGWAQTSQHSAGGAVFEYDGSEEHADGQATVRVPGEHQGDLQTTDATICTNHYMQRTAPPAGGDSMTRYRTLATSIDAAVASGGLDASDAYDMLGDVARSWTAHATILDTSDRSLKVWIAEREGQAALEADPLTLSLDELWE